MLKRPENHEFSEYHTGYIQLVPEGDLIPILEQQLKDTICLLNNLTEEKAGFRYAPEKWSIKEMVGHMADTERIMSYRLLRFSRGDETPLAGFEEDDYVRGASFDAATLEDLIDNFTAVRKATIALLKGIAPEAFLRSGFVNKGNLSARALAYILAGHELHHRSVLKARYLG
jgi:hypothetical protein